MIIENEIFKDKTGEEILLRNAKEEDSQDLIDYLKITNAQSPYLICEPEEITLTLDEEKEFIKRKNESKDELLLLAFCGGKHIGNCSLMSVGSSIRYRHRCSVAIALYEEYCHRGIGRKMLERVLKIAKEIGYEQAELEVVTKNTGARALYEDMGFVQYGELHNSTKYKDGSYADTALMVKRLV